MSFDVLNHGITRKHRIAAESAASTATAQAVLAQGYAQLFEHLVSPTAATISATETDVSIYSSAVVNVEIEYGTGHFEGSSDGVTYSTVPAKNIETGKAFSRIDMWGRYFIDLRGVSHLKYVVDFSSPNKINPTSASAMLYAAYEQGTPLLNPVPAVQYAPDNLITGTPAPLPSNRIMCDVDLSNGTIYANAGGYISKSTNGGVSFTNIFTTIPWGSATLNYGLVKKLHNGKILALVPDNLDGETEIWLSDANEENFAKVYSFDIEGKCNPGFGLSIYEDYIIVAMYKEQVRAADFPMHIHASKDCGATWGTIHTAPAIERWHYHDVAYDPYTGRIWMTNGDSPPLSNAWYTDDWGVTWESLWPTGVSKSQFTTVSVLPDRVVFCTDQVGFQGAWVYYKTNGILSPVYEPVFSRGDPGRTGDASYRGKQSWSTDGVVYYFSDTPSVVIATKDGYNFYTLWSSETSSFYNHFGVDVNGKIYLLGPQGALITDAPTWSQI